MKNTGVEKNSRIFLQFLFTNIKICVIFLSVIIPIIRSKHGTEQTKQQKASGNL